MTPICSTSGRRHKAIIRPTPPGERLSKNGLSPWQNLAEFAHLRTALLFAMIKKFREYSFLLPRYHCECSQSGRG